MLFPLDLKLSGVLDLTIVLPNFYVSSDMIAVPYLIS